MQEIENMAQSVLGLRLTRTQLSMLAHYERELLEWNTRYNLTAIDDPSKVRVKHFLDSLSCLPVMREKPMDRLIDIGTGAGFPGIPIKIVCPSLKLTLVDSVSKKIAFCEHVIKTLHLEEVEVIQERAEVVGQMPDHREKYDWSTARAVAALPVLAEYLLPLVRVSGSMLAMKGQDAPIEAHTAERAMRVLGGHLRKLVPVTLPGVADERYLIVIDKVAASPKAYPRRVGLPSKKPL